MKMVSFSQQVPVALSVPLAEDCPCNQAPVQAIDQPIEYNVWKLQQRIVTCPRCPWWCRQKCRWPVSLANPWFNRRCGYW